MKAASVGPCFYQLSTNIPLRDEEEKGSVISTQGEELEGKGCHKGK